MRATGSELGDLIGQELLQLLNTRLGPWQSAVERVWKRKVWHSSRSCRMLNKSKITGGDLIQDLRGQDNGNTVYKNNTKITKNYDGKHPQEKDTQKGKMIV